MTDILIIGAGCAGMTAAIYATRNGRSVTLLERESIGGQIVFSPHVDNYPGFERISGIEFSDRLYAQTQRFGVRLELAEVLSTEKKQGYFEVATTDGVIEARTIIVASGASHRRLGLEGEEALIGNGVSYCAVCDGAFFSGSDVVVVGGGNTALQDALYLTGYCRQVILVHRRDSFRGETHLANAVIRHSGIQRMMSSEVVALDGNGRLTAITVFNRLTGERRRLVVSGLFVAIGQIPATEPFRKLVSCTPEGYIIAGENCHTDLPGVFAAGDCRDKRVRQLVTAASDGATAALAACDYLDELSR